MNNENEKDLDNLFKKGLEDDPVNHSEAYKEEDWSSLEQMLDKHNKRRGIIYWLPILSSAAAILLLVWGWWAFETRPKHNNTPNRLNASNSHQQPKIKTDNNHVKQSSSITRDDITPDKKQVSPASVNYANNNTPHINSNKHDVYSKTAITQATRAIISDNGNSQNTMFSKENTEALTAVSNFSITEHRVIAANPVSVTNLPERSVNTTTIAVPAIAKVKTKPAFRPKYALSVLASSDANGVGSFQQSKLGGNVGVLFSIGISKRLTISTGGTYSIKPYVEGLANYNSSYKPPGNPINVLADCRVLDIPLNVDYRVYNKGLNKFSIGTGLSSYLMLKETFNYNYAEPFAYAPKPFTVLHSGNYLLGVLNVNATYERQINSKVGISIEPYLKLPLTNIGYSQVRLQTTGVAVGLTWNFNSLTKP